MSSTARQRWIFVLIALFAIAVFHYAIPGAHSESQFDAYPCALCILLSGAAILVAPLLIVLNPHQSTFRLVKIEARIPEHRYRSATPRAPPA